MGETMWAIRKLRSEPGLVLDETRPPVDDSGLEFQLR